MQRTLIWDIPTRLFHWTLATSFALAWLTSESDTWRSVHVFAGYLMVGLVGFRVLWGFAGSHFSRFSSFRFGPGEAMTYLKQLVSGRAPRHVGHNPTGSLAIYAMLVLTMIVGASGVLTLGSDEQQGLAAGWFSFSQAQTLKELHELTATLMLLLVGGHIVGVVAESVMHKENLARSMVTGNKLAAANTPGPARTPGSRSPCWWRCWVLLDGGLRTRWTGRPINGPGTPHPKRADQTTHMSGLSESGCLTTPNGGRSVAVATLCFIRPCCPHAPGKK
jgi:cytochrome b